VLEFGVMSPVAALIDNPAEEVYTPPLKAPVPLSVTLCDVEVVSQNGVPRYEIDAVGGEQLLAVQMAVLAVKQVPAAPVGVRVMVTLSPGVRLDMV
jgi:hypothetical protein